MLTTWGTEIMRKKDDLHWVKKVEEIIKENQKNNIVSIVTDIRFPNEIDYIHKIGGSVIHLTMIGNKPANDYEKKNDPLLRKNADCLVEWENTEMMLYKNALFMLKLHLKIVYQKVVFIISFNISYLCYMKYNPKKRKSTKEAHENSTFLNSREARWLRVLAELMETEKPE